MTDTLKARDKVVEGWGALTSSLERAKGTAATIAVRDFLDELLPLVRADLTAMQTLFNCMRQKIDECADYVQFFENDCNQLLTQDYDRLKELMLDGSNLRFMVEGLRYKLESKWKKSGWLDQGWRDYETVLTRAFADYSEFTREMRDLYERFDSELIPRMLSRARVELENSIAQGLGTSQEAKALFWLSFVLFLEEGREDSSPSTMPVPSAEEFTAYVVSTRDALRGREFDVKRYTKARPPLNMAVKRFERHLRTNPTDVEALELLVSAYRMLERPDALFRTEIALKKAQAMGATDTAPLATLEAQHDVSGVSFEQTCQRLLAAMGFVTTMTNIAADGGIDIIASRSDPILSGKYIVQCKDWQGKVGVKLVRELYGVVVSEDANKGILITSSGFTESAVKFAAGKRLELIDGEEIARLLSAHL